MTGETPSRHIAEFTRIESGLPGHGLTWLRSARRRALDRFAELGFPTTRQEDWKYTNTAAIARRQFHLTAASANCVSAAQVDELAFADACMLVFVNGRLAPAMSRLSDLPAGVTVGSLAHSLEHGSEVLEEAVTRRVDSAANGFAALNAAFMRDGACIVLKPGVALEKPIHLLFLVTEAELETHLFNLIVAGAGAKVDVVEHFAGPGGTSYLTNSVTQIMVERGSQVSHHKLQQESLKAYHVAAIDAELARGSFFGSESFALGAGLARSDISATLKAEHCETSLRGLYHVTDRQHVDHHTRIDHACPHGTSREFYKGVLDGAARAVFNGKVIVRQDAQRTDAHQSNKNLLLSQDAEVDTKPELEIYADDVKCTHGATVGQLDETQLFYLRSRGMDRAEARSLLTYAFAEEIISATKIAPLKERLDQILLNRLPGGNRIRDLL